jgi:hypothetical protein
MSLWTGRPLERLIEALYGGGRESRRAQDILSQGLIAPDSSRAVANTITVITSHFCAHLDISPLPSTLPPLSTHP